MPRSDAFVTARGARMPQRAPRPGCGERPGVDANRKRYPLGMRRFLLATAVALSACASSAPHTVGAAAVNSGLALAGAAAQRAGGGCYAVCTNGTVCNPKTGLCEKPPADAYCEDVPGGGMRCVPLQIGKEREVRPGAGLPVGVSPATGTVQPPPAEASPR
jgi:hypothetical protein